MSDGDILTVVWAVVSLVWAGVCLNLPDRERDGRFLALGLAGLLWPLAGCVLFGYWLGGKAK